MNLPEIARMNNGIIKMRLDGYCIQDIAHMFNLDREYVQRVLEHRKQPDFKIKTFQWGGR